ncbi:MAG: DUF6434 domain-containing protein [Bacteroidota bacterium]
MTRPDFTDIKTGVEFNNWYWLKAEMVDICKAIQLPYSGSKFELRDRIIYALDNDGALKPVAKKKKAHSKFNWARAELSRDTVITDNISFGPNFRRFMKAEIGDHFSCHGDFMAWAKSNAGKTLEDAILKWEELERRKENPNFRREIAAYNMFNQYVRDFLDDNKGYSFQEARKYWDVKKQLPTKGGFVKYEKSDLALI